MKSNLTEEMVAWVDENEQFIKAIPISLANSHPKYLHQEVVVVIVDNDGRALLQQRSKYKRMHPGMWTVAAAGHVTYGDTVESSAHKELEEEMGIKNISLTQMFREKIARPTETNIAYWFVGRYNSETVTIQKDEVDDYKWISESDFDDFCQNHHVSPRTIATLRRYWSGEWDHLLQE